MKKEIYLHMPEPCHENWEQMSPVQQGRFCGSCAKKVIDFSHLSDKQILDVLSKAANTTCGRFSTQQLERPIVQELHLPVNPYKLFLSAFIPAFLLANTSCAKAQKGKVAIKTETVETITLGIILPEIKKEIEITGIIMDEEKRSIAGASVAIKGTNKPVLTNAEGKFSIKAFYYNQQLQISHSGYIAKEITLKKDDEKPIAIVLSKKDILFKGEVTMVTGYLRPQLNNASGNRYNAAKKVTRQGIVVDETRQPIFFASISINTNKHVVADSIGRFSFDADPNNKSALLTASSVGFESKTFEVDSAGNNPVEIVLKNKAALDKVVVKCFSAKTISVIAGGLSIVRTVTIRDTANTFIQKVFKNEMFKAYPNPAKIGSNVTLTFKKAGNYAIQLFDNSGKLFIQKELLNQQSNQPVSITLPAGMGSGIYYLKATNSSLQKQYIDKLIIQ